MYEDSWYSFVPDLASKKPTPAAQPLPHRRGESLVPQSNAHDVAEPPRDAYEAIQGSDAPPEPTLTRRAASCSDLDGRVEARRDARGDGKTPPGKGGRGWKALHLCAGAPDWLDAEQPAAPSVEDEVLRASQRDYLLYQDQLTLTERHLEGLIDDADAALKLLTSLSGSFQAVEAQTSSFQSKCESLVTEQRRLERLADDVGTDLHYYAYLDTATRQLNAPGASRLVDDEAFGDMVDNVDACVRFMTTHESYRERESYLARYHALLAKALHLLEHAFSARLQKVSSDVARQIAATESESARHALAYGRFEEMMADSFSLLPNVRRAVRGAFDAYGRPVEASSVSGLYASAAAGMFRTHLTTRDRVLGAMTQRHADALPKEAEKLSAETACRNLVKQSFEKLYNEDGLFVAVFGVEPAWSSSAGSAFQAIKAVGTSMAHPGNLAPLAHGLQAVLQNASLQAVCNVVGWIASEYSVSEGDDDESPSLRKHREYAARLLAEHVWAFTDRAFAAEVTRSISWAPVPDATLKTEPAADGAVSSNAHPLVARAMRLLAMFDQAMPKERSAKNSPVVFNIVRETLQVLQRAEARIRLLKAGTDADLFMIQNLLVIKNELFSLEIGDIRSQPAAMQHLGRIWDALGPHKWAGFLGSVMGGSLWSRGAPPAVTAKTLTAEDASEQLDELLRQSIYAFTRRWGTLIKDAQGGKAGGAKVEAELDGALTAAFCRQPEVVSKLKEAIRLQVQAQSKAQDAQRGAKRY